MKKILKVISLLMVTILFTGLFSACQSKGSPTGEKDESGSPVQQSNPVGVQEFKGNTGAHNTLEFVNLTMYLMGAAPRDTQMVLDELNKKLKTDLNCSVTIKHVDWANWTTKYKLVLASGEDVDAIYTAWWDFFAEESQKGAFLALNGLLPRYCPNVWAQWPKSHWPPASYKGNIYAVPSYEQTYDQWGVVTRRDLRMKYNIPEVNSFETLEVYLDTIKAKEPKMIPMNNAGYTGGSENAELFIEYGLYNYATLDTSLAVIKADQKDITDVRSFVETPEFEAFCKLMRRWFQKGFWSKSILSNKMDSSSQFQNNLSATANAHYSIAAAFEASMQSRFPDIEPQVEFWSAFDSNGMVHPTPAMQNAMAIPRISGNPERMLMVIDKMDTDEEYNRLITYGIRGKHWELTADGKYKLPDGIKVDASGFPLGALGQWAFRNPKTFFRDSTESAYFIEKTKHFIETATPDKLDGFNFNKTRVRTECSAVDQVLAGYLPQLLYGTAWDTGDALMTLRQKLKEAGADRVIAEVKSQLIEFAIERENGSK